MNSYVIPRDEERGMTWKERKGQREEKALGIYSHGQAVAEMAPIARRRATESQEFPGKWLVEAIALRQ